MNGINPVVLQAVLWALGIAVMALFAVIGFLVNWNRGQDQRMGNIEKTVADNALHVSEGYVRGHEIAEVKREIAAFRQELAQSVGEIRKDVQSQMGDLTKAVYQLMGKSS